MKYERIHFYLHKDGTIEKYRMSIVPKDYLNSYKISQYSKDEIKEPIITILKKGIIKVGQRCKGLIKIYDDEKKVILIYRYYKDDSKVLELKVHQKTFKLNEIFN